MVDVDLSVRISRVVFKNPIVVASGPPTRSAEHVLKCIKAGAAGAVTKTITYDVRQRMQPRPRMFVVRPEDAIGNRLYSFYSVDLMSEHEPEVWTRKIKEVKGEIEDYGGVLIASIAGRDLEEWERLAELLEDAGADMLELNLSCPHIEKGEMMGRAAASEPKIISEVIRAVKDSTSLPVIGKLTPHGANPLELAKLMASSGVDAVVSTARFQGLIVDPHTMRPILWGGFGGYGGPWQLPISIGWTAHISMEGLGVPIIGSGGVSTWEDVVGFILVGASAVQLCTAIVTRGLRVVPDLVSNLRRWMAERGFSNLNDFLGIALDKIVPLDGLERRKLHKLRVTQDKCTRCGVCVKVCPYDALSFGDVDRIEIPIPDQDRCDNCGLCVSICTAKAIFLDKVDKTTTSW